MDWIEDDKGNKCSVEYFGGEAEARAAIESLKDCERCINCSRCSRCSDCSDLKSAKPQDGRNVVPPVPAIPDIHQRVFEAASAPNALNMDSWHTCETTHCRAGWVVALAGEAGKALERFHDTPLAASLIYQASSPLPVSMARFFDRNEAAMADMKRLAELEQHASNRSA